MPVLELPFCSVGFSISSKRDLLDEKKEGRKGVTLSGPV